MESKISLSKITLSSNDSWGPDPSFVFEQYRNLPFAPFNKLEKLGKYCDISNPAAAKPTTSTLGSTVPVDEEEEFKIVETRVLGKPKDKPTYVKRKPYTQPTQPTQAAQTVYQNKLYKTTAKQQQRRHYNARIQVTRTKFKDNAGVQGDWDYITDANKSNFDKMPVNNVKVVDLKTVGRIPEYDKTWTGRSNPKKNAPFALPNTITLGTGPRSDRNMLEIIEKDRDTQDLVIYATDTLLSTLLTVKTSIYPWEIQVVKEGNQIFLEPNEKNKVNYIDILTVNENTAGDLPEDEKDLLKLCIEATNVNRKFIEISTKGTEIKDFSTNEAGSTDVPDRKVYRYRKWTLDNKINVVVRSEVDAFVKEGESTSFVKVCAFNECQPQLDWKSNIEQNRGAVISSELRNNLCKVCSWLCQAFLSECNQFRFGFVTKPNAKEARYSVLTVEDMSTTTLSKTVNYGLKDNWSIVKALSDIISKEDDGTFLLAKPAYKQTIRVYKVPEKHDEENIES